MNVSFTEYQPHQDLTPFIQSYWSGNFNLSGEDNFNQSIVPNGCIELIIHLTDDHCYLSKNDDQWCKSPIFTLMGLFPKSYDVRFLKHVKVFGIRFYPDGIRNIFGVAPSEFLSTYEDGSDVLGKEFYNFCAQIREAKTSANQKLLTDKFILKQLAKNINSYDYTHLVMKAIRSSNGMANYQYLVNQIPISLRQLQREFKNQYGLTITDYMRLSRINAIHQYMQNNSGSLTELAYDLDFTDQSHMIREYKNFVGVPPRKFIRNRDSFVVNIG